MCATGCRTQPATAPPAHRRAPGPIPQQFRTQSAVAGKGRQAAPATVGPPIDPQQPGGGDLGGQMRRLLESGKLVSRGRIALSDAEFGATPGVASPVRRGVLVDDGSQCVGGAAGALRDTGRAAWSAAAPRQGSVQTVLSRQTGPVKPHGRSHPQRSFVTPWASCGRPAAPARTRRRRSRGTARGHLRGHLRVTKSQHRVPGAAVPTGDRPGDNAGEVPKATEFITRPWPTEEAGPRPVPDAAVPPKALRQACAPRRGAIRPLTQTR